MSKPTAIENQTPTATLSDEELEQVAGGTAATKTTKPTRVTVEMYCEEMEFKYGAGDVT